MTSNQEFVQDEGGRVSLNIRIDSAKFGILESMRQTGFGLAQTQRNRSDVYNEVLGYGIQTNDLRRRLGDQDFARLWRILQNADIKKFNLEKIEHIVMKGKE
jgi:hypothetical protein